MTDIRRELLDAFTTGDGRRPAAVLISFPEHDDPALTIRGVTSLWRTADGLRVTADVLVLQGDTYVEGGSGGGWVLDDSDFSPDLLIEGSPRPVDEDETAWLVPRIEVAFAPGGAVASRVVARPSDESDDIVQA